MDKYGLDFWCIVGLMRAEFNNTCKPKVQKLLTDEVMDFLEQRWRSTLPALPKCMVDSANTEKATPGAND
eukprot:401990-Karenia_brevis.AAC.1